MTTLLPARVVTIGSNVYALENRCGNARPQMAELLPRFRRATRQAEDEKKLDKLTEETEQAATTLAPHVAGIGPQALTPCCHRCCHTR
jgi:hypothetical protein